MNDKWARIERDICSTLTFGRHSEEKVTIKFIQMTKKAILQTTQRLSKSNAAAIAAKTHSQMSVNFVVVLLCSALFIWVFFVVFFGLFSGFCMVSLVFADSNLPLPLHEWGWKGDWVITF